MVIIRSTFEHPVKIRFWFEVDSFDNGIELKDLTSSSKKDDDLRIEFVDEITGQRESQYISRDLIKNLKAIRFSAKHDDQ